jgi:amphi-Trp domain-containing protein
MPSKRPRDIEKAYSTTEFVAKLRRFADALETGRAFEIQIAGERLHVSSDAHFSIEHERGDGTDEIEFQVRWATKKPT